MELRLGFLVSGRGSNFEAILNSIERGELEAYPKVLLSSNPKAKALEIAKARNIPCCYISSDEDIVRTLREYDVNMVVLAGYMRKLGEKVLEAYPSRITNIHPSLLPKYGGEGMYGMKVHDAVISSGDEESGATVHFVTSEYDSGKILAQCNVKRFVDDTPEKLAERVLAAEHILYPQTLIGIQKGRISLD